MITGALRSSSTTRRRVHKKGLGQTRGNEQSHCWNTGGLRFDIRGQSKPKVAQPRKTHEHGPQSSVPCKNMRKEEKQHTHKTNINHWESFTTIGRKSEDLKIDDWTRWQETVEKIATTAGEHVDVKKRQDPARHADDEQNTGTSGTKKTKQRRNRTEWQQRKWENGSGEEEDF